MTAMEAMVGLLSMGLVLVYSVCAVLIGAHILGWMHLLWLRRRRAPVDAEPLQGDPPTTLLLQLPLYNEEAVVDALLACVAELDWPGLRVQVLDDSSDATPERVARALPDLRSRGLDIRHVRRGNREGFKAGALAHGLVLDDAHADGPAELVAILDADFRPDPDWLRRAVAALGPEDGLLQCHWAFDNPDHSVLTRAQALHLDAHFCLEQQARWGGDLLMGFNGTAGVWRRRCIEEAGGWEGDTLTEDLDLSYRAQLSGWQLRFADGIGVPCELPEELAAIRAQQHRWIRGGAQVGRKLLRRLWASDQPLRRKLQGTAHLLASSVFLPVLALCIATPALPTLLHLGPDWLPVALAPSGIVLRGVLACLLLAFGTVCVVREGSLGRGLLRLLRDFPVYMVLATAICAHTARAAWLGWTGPTGTFVRTPKGGQRVRKQRWPETLPLEVVLTLWSSMGLGTALLWGPVGIVPFLGVQALGFGAFVGITVAERRAPPVAARGPLPAPEA